MSQTVPVKLPVSKPLAICSDGSSQAIASGATAVLSFDTNVHPLQGITKATSSTGHSFTITSSGLYTVEAVCVFAAVTGASNTYHAGLEILKNGVSAHIGPKAIISKLNAGDTFFANAHVEKTLLLVEGDVITITGTQTSSGSNTTGQHKLTIYQHWAYN
jgi:hypothetical protein